MYWGQKKPPPKKGLVRRVQSKTEDLDWLLQRGWVGVSQAIYIHTGAGDWCDCIHITTLIRKVLICYSSQKGVCIYS